MEELTCITDDEYPILAKVIIEGQGSNPDPDKVLKELQLIDRGLIVIKSRSLLTRKSPTVRQQLDALIENHATGRQPFWDARSRKYVFADPKDE